MPIKKSEFDRKGDRDFGFKKPEGATVRKQKDIPPDKEVLKQLGGTGKKRPVEGRRPAGNTEAGFIQSGSIKKATSHGGMAPPKKKAAKTSTRSDGRKQFGQPAGKKPF